VPCLPPLGVAEWWGRLILIVVLVLAIVVLVAAGWTPAEVESVLGLITIVIVISSSIEYRI
jgi:hypothetical protein